MLLVGFLLPYPKPAITSWPAKPFHIQPIPIFHHKFQRFTPSAAQSCPVPADPRAASQVERLRAQQLDELTRAKLLGSNDPSTMGMSGGFLSHGGTPSHDPAIERWDFP